MLFRVKAKCDCEKRRVQQTGLTLKVRNIYFYFSLVFCWFLFAIVFIHSVIQVFSTQNIENRNILSTLQHVEHFNSYTLSVILFYKKEADTYLLFSCLILSIWRNGKPDTDFVLIHPPHNFHLPCTYILDFLCENFTNQHFHSN